MRRNRAGNSFLIFVIVLFVALSIGMYFLSRGHEEGLGRGVPALAGAVPQDTRIFFGFDARDSRQYHQALERVKQWAAKPDNAKQFQENLGVPLTTLIETFEPDGCLFFLPVEGQQGLVSQAEKPLEGGLIIALHDAEKGRQVFETILKQQKVQATRSEEAGREVFTVGAGLEQWAYHFRGNVLYVTSGKGAMLRVLAVADEEKPSLADSPSFQDALRRVHVGSDSNAVLLFADIHQSLTGWEKLAPGATEAQKATANGFQYLVLGAWGEQSGGFLKLDKGSQSRLIQALLTPQNVPNNSARVVPQAWGSYSSLNLLYLYSAVLEMVRLIPEASAAVDSFPSMFEANMGVSLDEVRRAIDGELAISSDFVELMRERANRPEPSAEEKATESHVACVSNVRNLGTALEMYSTDFSGRYPEALGKLTPNYLRIIPNCPAAGSDTYSTSYQVGVKPDAYTFFCQGTHHVHPDRPMYSAYEGLVDPDRERLMAAREKMQQDEDPEATMVFVLGVKDPELFRAVFTKILAQAGDTNEPAGKIGDIEVRSMQGGGEWMLLTQPSPVAVIAAGPRNRQALEKVAAAAANPGSSMAQLSKYSSAASAAGPQWIALSYQDFGGMLSGFASLLAEEGDTSEQAQLVQEVARDSKDLQEAAFATVDQEGLRLGGGGIGGSLMFMGGVGAAVMVPNFVRARGQGQLTACKSNLKNIGTASEMYSTDYEGRYPPNIGLLTPNYLRVIPTCPAAGVDTYSATYTTARDPDHYTFWCQGHHHAGVGVAPDYPKYTSMQGLIER